MIDKPTPKEIDDLVYELRQAGKDETYSLASAVLAKWGQPSGATEEVENLRKALVYAAFALHDTPQYMLAQGIALIDGDTVRVSRDGWTVEASVNPHRQPAPAQAAEPVAYVEVAQSESEVSMTWGPEPAGFSLPNGRYPLYTTQQPTQPRAGAVPLTCEWTHNEDDGFWETACGEAWRFDDGGPGENNMHFCHSCGNSLRIKGGQHGTE